MYFAGQADKDLREFERQTAAACCPAEVIVEGAVWIYDTLPHYRQPSWWQPEYGVPATTSGSEARLRR